jgi:imidazolonepropionase
MSKILLKNIRQLIQVEETPRKKVCGAEMKKLPLLEDAWLAIEDGIIVGFGLMNDWEGISDWRDLEIIDASGKLVLPAWIDSHTHLVFANSRQGEFADRISGLTYEEIAARGGGILNSAKHMELASEEELIKSTLLRLKEIENLGTGAVEIKSGYGLSLESELKMLRVIRELKKYTKIKIKSTFLGAHAYPTIYKENKRGYIDLLIHEMIPKVSEEKLADFCDVFCERNYFSQEETIEILDAGKKYGLIPKVHANQLSNSGGVQAGVNVNAISVDHLEYVEESEIKALLSSATMPVILPGAQWFLSLPYPPARKMIDAGLPICIATDFNPGSSPSGNMNFMMSLACVQYKMSPEEVINAATINAAYAMGISETHGSICIGKKASLIITKELPDYSCIPYYFAHNPIDKILL